MKDNKLYIVIIATLCILSLIIAMRNSHFDSHKNRMQSSLAKPCIGCDESPDRTIPSIESDYVPLNLNSAVSSYDKNLCTLKDILRSDSMYLIFKYPLSYCGDCINEICTELEQLKDSISCIHTMIT